MAGTNYPLIVASGIRIPEKDTEGFYNSRVDVEIPELNYNNGTWTIPKITLMVIQEIDDVDSEGRNVITTSKSGPFVAEDVELSSGLE